MSEQGIIRRHERSLRDTIPMPAGLSGMLTNKSKLSHQAGMGLVCPICCTTFYRAPSHVARVSVSYCSTACHAEGQKVRIETHCVTCGTSMEQTPSDAIRIVTCSKRCSSMRRCGANPNPRGFAAYKATVQKVCARACCDLCQSRSGPWVVRGLNPQITESGETVMTIENATLVCRNCYFYKSARRLGRWAR